jgi:hypothetical protein
MSGRGNHTQAEDAYLQEVAELGCIVCRTQGRGYVPCQVHHIKRDEAGQHIGLGKLAPHVRAFGLCFHHHEESAGGEHARHAGERTFARLYGSEEELLEITEALLEIKRAQENPFNQRRNDV